MRRALGRRGVAAADADDLVQSVMLHLLARWGAFAAHSPGEQRAFAVRRAVGAAADLARRERHAREANDVVGSTACVPDPDRAAMAREALARAEVIAEAIDRADGGVWRMHVVEELSCTEIAERLALPLGTVKTRLRKSRAAVATFARDTLEGRSAPGGGGKKLRRP